MRTERKKVILFKDYLDLSEPHDFREMTISILHVMTSSKMVISADFFLNSLTFHVYIHLNFQAKYPEHFVPKALVVLELWGGAKIASLLQLLSAPKYAKPNRVKKKMFIYET